MPYDGTHHAGVAVEDGQVKGAAVVRFQGDRERHMTMWEASPQLWQACWKSWPSFVLPGPQSFSCCNRECQHTVWALFAVNVKLWTCIPAQ